MPCLGLWLYSRYFRYCGVDRHAHYFSRRNEMAIVTLVSGGFDSTLMALLTAESKIDQFPLFINYGQIFCKREYNACIKRFNTLRFPRPRRMNLRVFARTIPSELTPAK